MEASPFTFGTPLRMLRKQGLHEFSLGADSHPVPTKLLTSSATSAVLVTGVPGRTDTTSPVQDVPPLPSPCLDVCLTLALMLTTLQSAPGQSILHQDQPQRHPIFTHRMAGYLGNPKQAHQRGRKSFTDPPWSSNNDTEMVPF